VKTLPGRRSRLLVLSLLFLAAPLLRAQSSNPLKIIFVDVEGGQATLFITPAHESLLVDTGWPDRDGRDADRIVAAAKQSGIDHVDYVLLTHYHDDHTGGVPQLVARIPVGTFIDHGPNRELDHGPTEHGYSEYQRVLAAGKSRRLLATPGMILPVKGITAEVISADGKLIPKPLPGAGQSNPACSTTEDRPADQTENGRSLGIEITFGKLKILDLGDLTWDKEKELMCPVNKLGHVDILVVSHHGWYQSSSPALIDGIHPRIAVMDNGETKGGSTPTFDTLNQAPGLEALWQLHYSDEAGAKNRPAEYIANPTGTDRGYNIEVTASPDGAFSVLNERTRQAKQYAAGQ
jgi:beta-lactamase superfamily II metal-dependent hydrolase